MKAKIAFVLCLTLVTLIGVGVSASAEPTTTAPDDLTGYTVTVPAGWSAMRGYGIFNIITNDELTRTNFYVGYVYDPSEPATLPTPDVVVLADPYGLAVREFSSSSPIQFFCFGGSDVSNTSLISWLVDNNATFDNGSSSDPDPEPTVTSIPIGSYSLINPLSDIPNVDWMDGSGYSYYYTANGTISYGGRIASISGFSFDLDYFQTSSIYDLTISVTLSDYTEVDIALIEIYNATRTVTPLNGFQYIFFSEDVVLDSNSYETFFDIFEFYDPDEVETPDNPWIYILEKVIDALKVDIWGNFSPWDIFSTLTGIFIVVWILKLIAGG